MATLDQEEEEITGREIRRRMWQRGVTMSQLAREAGIKLPHVSNALAGKEVLSHAAQERLEQSLVTLGLAEAEPEPRAGVFRLPPKSSAAS
jgi:transcriptional regulator with XRE-family HTH domain